MSIQDSMKNLLANVRALTIVDRKQREHQKSRGDSFNLFKEMNLDSDEVRLHSSFLAMLLDPGRSHGQLGRYLSPFVAMLNEKGPSANSTQAAEDGLGTDSEILNPDGPMEMDADHAIAEVEKYIGPVDGDRGGRMDIFIKDERGNAIIIENKIYADDQNSQLKRYWNFAQDSMRSGSIRQYKLVYLTLDGRSASSESKAGLGEDDYMRLSYRQDIIPWLQRCVELSVTQPLIRETIRQYIDVLSTITHSDMENNNEVLSIMSQEDNIEAVFAIASNINTMIDNIMNNILRPQLAEIASERGFELHFNSGSGWMTESWVGWSMSNSRWKYFDIAFEFERKALGRPIIGFHKKSSSLVRADIPCWEELSARATTIAKNNQNWIYRYFTKYQDWNTPEALKAIMDGHTMKQYLSSLIDEQIRFAEGLDV